MTKIKSLFFLFTLMLISHFGFSQRYQDVVYLKNGSVIRGTIVLQVFKESITIESRVNTWIYKMDEIEKIEKVILDRRGRPVESGLAKREIKIKPSELKKGFMGLAEVGVSTTFIGAFDVGTTEIAKLNIEGGYRFNPYFVLALGSGIRKLNHHYDGETDTTFFPINVKKTLIPIFADLRVNFANRKISPFLSLRLGYAFDANNGLSKFGTMVNPSVGIAINVFKRLLIHVGFNHEILFISDKDFDYMGNFDNQQVNFGIVTGITF